MDITLYYREKGNREPLILLHGNGEDGTYFNHQMDYFSDRYKVIALDTRGHGKSPRVDAPFTISQFAMDLNAFMDGKGIEKAIILGFSDGANIAMKFALKFPQKAKALILNGGNLNAKGVKRSVQIPIEIGYKIASRFANKSEDARKKAEMMGLMVNDPNIDPKDLEKIQVPALVICGTKDMIRKSHTKEIAAHIPGAKLVIVQGDHFIANKRYDAFNQEVENFLQTI